MTNDTSWTPPDFNHPDKGRLGDIQTLFTILFPQQEYGDLAQTIGRYWLDRLKAIWEEKSPVVKNKDKTFNPADPLSRVEQKTVLISYADSVKEPHTPTLETLERFLSSYFPAIRGLHILPPCEMSATRFNDGGFSQINRTRIHHVFGTNLRFEEMMKRFWSMTDFVLNHVDIDNPIFQQYLAGDDEAGKCFYVLKEGQYQKQAADGDFDRIFRPRPFPLFTVFRRKPRSDFASKSMDQKIAAVNERFKQQGLAPLPEEVVSILSVFYKIKNDQMLLDDDYRVVLRFRDYLIKEIGWDDKRFFTISKIQETQNTPYIFQENIKEMSDFFRMILPELDIPADQSSLYARVYADGDEEIFGEMIRGLTTFSHVQVDLNTATYEGLKLLIDDFAWYLSMDLNMLRLDAANFAFKKWKTSCFGLGEVKRLLQLLYYSMDAVAPRMIPNLEVNAPLGTVLKQMADKQAPPPMMYDFHLACMVPTVFLLEDVRPLLSIFRLIRQHEISHDGIRFSLDESHDGKSVNGSGGGDGLLTYEQRKKLIDRVITNKGHVKYKSTSKRVYPADEFSVLCLEAGLDLKRAKTALFEEASRNQDRLILKKEIKNEADAAKALNIDLAELKENEAAAFFIEKIFHGKEPYELCIATIDVLPGIDHAFLKVKCYMAYKTLSFALMGRHVKSVYFNDLMGLENDHDLVFRTGELRNIKRTKSDRRTLEQRLSDPSSIHYWIAKWMNNTIALVDSDPAFHPQGNEADLMVDRSTPSIAYVGIRYGEHRSLIVINVSEKTVTGRFRLSDGGLPADKELIDNLTGKTLPRPSEEGILTLELRAFDRLWIKDETVFVDQDRLVAVGGEDDMRSALSSRHS